MKMTIGLSAALLHGSVLFAQQYTISTIAGGGQPPSSVQAASVRVPISGAIALDGAGAVYFSSGNAVMKVDTKGILTRVAGTGTYGLSGDGGPAPQAQLAWPAGLALDNSGNLFIADNANHRVRKVSADGTISTVIGSTAGYSGDGGPGANAQLNWPTGLAVDRSGNLFIADTANRAIRKVSASGIISTFATGLNLAEGVVADAVGNLYIADYIDSMDDCGDEFYSGRVLKVTADGTTTTTVDAIGQGLRAPQGIAADAAGNVYVADSIAGMVVEITPGGLIKTAAGNTYSYEYQCPAYVTPSDIGTLICPGGVAVDSAGNLYVSDSGRGRIARITPQGDVTNLVGDGTPETYWGDGGKATDSALDAPLGVAVDNAGNLYISDSKNSRVRKVSIDGVITTVAGTGIPGHSGDGGPAVNAKLMGPAGLALDASGNLYIADYADNRIRKVSTDGTIVTVAGRGDSNPPLGDGGLAINASFASPFGVAVDTSGNLYIADSFFSTLTQNERLGRLALCIERVELLFETFRGRFASVDRAPQSNWKWRRTTFAHGGPPCVAGARSACARGA